MTILDGLTGGFRSTGDPQQVTADVLTNPLLFPELFAERTNSKLEEWACRGTPALQSRGQKLLTAFN